MTAVPSLYALTLRAVRRNAPPTSRVVPAVCRADYELLRDHDAIGQILTKEFIAKSHTWCHEQKEWVMSNHDQSSSPRAVPDVGACSDGTSLPVNASLTADEICMNITIDAVRVLIAIHPPFKKSDDIHTHIRKITEPASVIGLTGRIDLLDEVRRLAYERWQHVRQQINRDYFVGCVMGACAKATVLCGHTDAFRHICAVQKYLSYDVSVAVCRVGTVEMLESYSRGSYSLGVNVAAESGNIDVMRRLYQRGIGSSLLNDRLALIVQRGYDEIIRQLFEWRIITPTEDSKGLVMDAAVRGGRVSTLRLLHELGWKHHTEMSLPKDP